MIRHMFVNRSERNQRITVTGTESIIVYRLGTSTPAKEPEQPVSEHEPGTWDFSLIAGTIFGIATIERVTYTNPDPSNIDLCLRSNKDPWPPPPPPPPAYEGVADFDTRWNKFLMALGPVDTSPPTPSPPVKYTIEQLEPVEPLEPRERGEQRAR